MSDLSPMDEGRFAPIGTWEGDRDLPPRTDHAEPIPFTPEGPQPLLREIAPGSAYPVAALSRIRLVDQRIGFVIRCWV